MKRFLPFFLVLMLAGFPALALGWEMPDSFLMGFACGAGTADTQSHDDEVQDDGDEEKEDDDYD